jgi:hypothetical protein
VGDPRSNLGFESEDQLRAFIEALSNSAIPGKFAYVGEAAAKTYNTHALTKEYGQVTRSVIDESSLLLEVWGQELGSIRTLADVGPGNGLHSAELLQRLSATANWSPSDYLAVDYSSHMAEIAKRNMKRLAPQMQINSIPFDIESTFRQASQLPDASEAIYLLLGNTIGNVDSMSRAIEGIRSLAGNGARLLIGCALFDEHRSAESYLKPYRMKTYVDCVLCPLIMIGAPRRLLEATAEFSPDTRTISTLVTFREDFQANVLGRGVAVKSASTIRCAWSRRFLPGEIPELLKRWNVSTLGMAEDLQNGHGTYCTII